MKINIWISLFIYVFNCRSSAQENNPDLFKDTTRSLIFKITDSLGNDISKKSEWYYGSQAIQQRKAILVTRDTVLSRDKGRFKPRIGMLKYLSEKEIKENDSLDALKPWHPSAYFTTGDKMPYLKTTDIYGNKIKH